MRPPRQTSPLRTLSLSFAFVLAACAPGGSGGSGLVDGVDLGGEEPDDVGGGGQTGVFTIEYPGPYRFVPVGTALDPLTPEISAEVLSIEIAPALPAGLTLDPGTGTIAGTPSAATPRRSYTVTAFNEFGSAQASVVLEIPGTPRFAYVANAGDSTLSIYGIEAGSGRLRPLGYQAESPFQIEPRLIAVHPTGDWIYVANDETATLGTLAVDETTGRLQAIDTDAVGHGPYALRVHPEGNFVYVVSNEVNTLRCFRIDPMTGELQQVGTSVTTAPDPVGLMMAPNGRYLVTVHGEPALLASYRIDTASGQVFLAEEQELLFDALPRGGAINPQSDQAYVTLAGVESVVRIAIDPFSAQMVPSEKRATLEEPHPLVLHPRGTFAYVLNDASPEAGGPQLSVYSVDAESGELSEPEHVPLGALPAGAALTPAGEHLYVLDRAGRMATSYSIDPETGMPIPVEGVRTRQLPSAVAVVGGDGPIRLRAGHVYVGGEHTGELSVLAVDALDGHLSPVGPPLETGARIRALEVDPLRRYLWVADASPGKEMVRVMALAPDGLPSLLHETLFGVRPTAIAAEPSGRFLYVTTDDTSNGLFALEIQPDGSLVNFDSAQVGFSPVAVEVDPTGQFLYVVNSGVEQPGNQGSMAMFQIDQATGGLTRLPPDAFAGGGPTCIAFSPSGEMAYSAFANTDLIGFYEIGAIDGRLGLVLQATETGPRPLDLALSPDGLYGYAAVSDPASSGHVELYDVRAEDGILYDATTGQLEARANYLAGNQPSALELAPDGRHLYVLNRTSATVTTFEVSALSGSLTAVDLDAVGLTPGAMALSIVVE